MPFLRSSICAVLLGGARAALVREEALPPPCSGEGKPAARKEDKRPNILFIFCDGLTRRAIGALVKAGYPNGGFVRVAAGQDGDIAIRLHDWMGTRISAKPDGVTVPLVIDGGCLFFRGVRKGGVVELSHPLALADRKETVRESELTVRWGGPDVRNTTPLGNYVRLYQRLEGAPKDFPPPPRAPRSRRAWAATKGK